MNKKGGHMRGDALGGLYARVQAAQHAQRGRARRHEAAHVRQVHYHTLQVTSFLEIFIFITPVCSLSYTKNNIYSHPCY